MYYSNHDNKNNNNHYHKPTYSCLDRCRDMKIYTPRTQPREKKHRPGTKKRQRGKGVKVEGGTNERVKEQNGEKRRNGEKEREFSRYIYKVCISLRISSFLSHFFFRWRGSPPSMQNRSPPFSSSPPPSDP